MEELGLADAVRALRSELTESVSEAGSSASDLRFKLGTVDIEFKVGIEAKGEGRAGVKFWVLDIGGTASRSSTNTHTIKLQLHPETKSGQEVYTGDDAARFPPLP